MAFPQVDEVKVSTGTAASIECDFPTTVPADDLMIVQLCADGTGNTITLNETGWTTLYNSAIRNHASAFFWKKAVGDEDGGTFTVDLGSSEQLVSYCSIISGWDGVTPPEITSGSNGSVDAWNPGSLTVSWGATDTLWIAAFTANLSVLPVISWPTSFTDNQNETANGTSCSQAMATREYSSTDTLDPPAGQNTLGGYHAVTIAVRPVGGTSDVNYHGTGRGILRGIGRGIG